MTNKKLNTDCSGLSQDATDFTIDSNQAQAILLQNPYCKTLEEVDPPVHTGGKDCRIDSVWSQEDFAFLKDSYCDSKSGHYTVNPSLWNNGRNNQLNGVFRVHSDMPVFQVRGYDMANISFVYTGSSWLIFDTLMSGECTQAAVDLFNDYLKDPASEGISYKEVGSKTIGTVIVSHSHIDHYGGLQTLRKINGGSLAIYAPKGFEQYAVSENLYAGVAMGRRASYQYGTLLAAGEQGRISIGIGQGQSTGTVGYLRPTVEVDDDFLKDRFDPGCPLHQRYLAVGNVRLYFQLTPGTEAPAEMNNYLEFCDRKADDPKAVVQHSALWMAENCNGTLHNLYTLRGAQVRDGKAWSDFLMETRSLWPAAEVVFQAHNWPRSNKDDTPDAVGDYLFRTAAAYKLLNDQCLLYMNQGYKPDEIAEKIRFPKPLERTAFLRPYYGTLKHNARAVYQRYLGWYDANPVHLDPLPERERAARYAAFLQLPGEKLYDNIKEEYENGNYRFVADICYQLLLGKTAGIDTDSNTCRQYLASSLEQLGYMAESGIWRNSYLSGAYDLRGNNPEPWKTESAASPLSGGPLPLPPHSMMRNMSYAMLLDYLAIVFDTDKASALGAETDLYLRIEPSVDGDPETACFHLWVKYGVLLYAGISQAAFDGSKVAKQCRLKAEELYSLIANIGLNDYIVELIDGLKDGKTSASYDLLQHIFCYMVDINKCRIFDIMFPANERYREKVYECAVMLESHYEDVKNLKPLDCYRLPEEDRNAWKNEYSRLVTDGVLDDLYFFSETPGKEFREAGFDGNIYKYQYCETLYECYKFLAGNYVPDTATRFVKFCIDLAEPYVNRFRRKPDETPASGMGARFYPFDEEDLSVWQQYCIPVFNQETTDGEVKDIYTENIAFFTAGASDPQNSGIGPDGKFYGSELLHFLYLCYKLLYTYSKPKVLGRDF